MNTLLNALKTTLEVKTSLKTKKIRNVQTDEKRYGLLDSGATNNVREMKKKERYKGLIPIEIEVAFDSEVTTSLFINPYGTIIGPEGTKNIASMNETV